MIADGLSRMNGLNMSVSVVEASLRLQQHHPGDLVFAFIAGVET